MRSSDCTLVWATLFQYEGKKASAQVLIFSHSVRMLRIIEKLVTLKGYDYETLDGQTPQV